MSLWCSLAKGHSRNSYPLQSMYISVLMYIYSMLIYVYFCAKRSRRCGCLHILQLLYDPVARGCWHHYLHAASVIVIWSFHFLTLPQRVSLHYWRRLQFWNNVINVADTAARAIDGVRTASPCSQSLDISRAAVHCVQVLFPYFRAAEEEEEFWAEFFKSLPEIKRAIMTKGRTNFL